MYPYSLPMPIVAQPTLVTHLKGVRLRVEKGPRSAAPDFGSSGLNLALLSAILSSELSDTYPEGLSHTSSSGPQLSPKIRSGSPYQ